MRLGRTLITLAVVLIVVLGSVYVATNFLGFGGGSPEAQATQIASSMRSVVALSEPVEAGERIGLHQLMVIEIETNNYNQLMFVDPAQVAGLYARSDYKTGQILSSTMMVTDPTQLLDEMHSTHAVIIPAGMVAIEIPINRFSGLAYGISPGDSVNVIATLAFVDLDTQFQTKLPNYLAGIISPGQNLVMTTNTEGLDPGASLDSIIITGENTWQNLVAQTVTGDQISIQGRAELDSLLNVPVYTVPSETTQRARVVSQTILFNRVILHVGNFPLLDAQGELIDMAAFEAAQLAQSQQVPEGQPIPPVELPDQPDIITLIVTPQEAVTINYMLYTGAQLTLALRPPNDVDVTPTDAVDLQYVMNNYRIPLPAQLPYGLETPVYELTRPILEND